MKKNFSSKSNVLRYIEVGNSCKIDQIWKFENPLILHDSLLCYGASPGDSGQKFYQKFISSTKRVLLSKFGENWLTNEDFLKNAQNWPLGGTPEGGRNFFWNFFFKYREGPSVQVWWRSDAWNKRFFNNHCKGEEEDEEEDLKRIWNPAAQGKNY